MLQLAGLVYIALIGVIAYSALKHRTKGWIVGLCFALFLLTFPWLTMLIAHLLGAG
jgi:hypothetical protein